jgi:CPA1 family monovalent cation:H+ antiporter
MSPFTAFAILITATALFSYINARYLRLPSTIGAMVAALAASIVLIALGFVGLDVRAWADSLLGTVDFDVLLMEGMLSFLLFAGALHVDLGDLFERKWSILSLATVGILISTFVVGTLIWLVFGWIGLDMPYIYALLFGALISPTDPIAVLGLLRRAGIPRTLETMITGESLLNDGVGVVLFLMILGFVTGGGGHGADDPSLTQAGIFFLQEAVGGLLLGVILGFIAYYLLKSIDNYIVEVLITLALVSGGYALAGALHTSGPLAMVSAGLLTGNRGRTFAMSDTTREHLDDFWELLDEILNAVLFVLVGLEVLVLHFSGLNVVAGLLTIPLVLGSRFLSVGLPISILQLKKVYPPYTIPVMTWGGLRGGISLALALSLPASPYRDLILVATYAVVVFSILAQGLSVGRFSRWAHDRSVASRRNLPP